MVGPARWRGIGARAGAAWDNPSMRTLVAGTVAQAETEVKRSRFLTVVSPVVSEVEAREVIAAERAKYPDARHHCSAFVLESVGATPRAHFSDDGEPSGTAGAPMLEVLVGADLINVVAVVTRYFGGTLLGTGGLVRAYAGGVQAALANAKLAQIMVLPRFEVRVDPQVAGKVDSEIRRRNWAITDAQWGNDVAFTFTVPIEDEADVEPLLANLTRSEPMLRRLADIKQEVPLAGG